MSNYKILDLLEVQPVPNRRTKGTARRRAENLSSGLECLYQNSRYGLVSSVVKIYQLDIRRTFAMSRNMDAHNTEHVP